MHQNDPKDKHSFLNTSECPTDKNYDSDNTNKHHKTEQPEQRQPYGKAMIVFFVLWWDMDNL